MGVIDVDLYIGELLNFGKVIIVIVIFEYKFVVSYLWCNLCYVLNMYVLFCCCDYSISFRVEED